MFAKITKVKKSKILANKRSGLQNPTSIRIFCVLENILMEGLGVRV
jgi:hypothetical protein